MEHGNKNFNPIEKVFGTDVKFVERKVLLDIYLNLFYNFIIYNIALTKDFCYFLINKNIFFI